MVDGFAGKEIMIKSILQVIPLYCMSLFLLPESLIDKVQTMINTFWWSSNKEGKKRSNQNWMRWEKRTT